ncbi:DUF6636 domain-containing protein [Humitalea sp. 24SJ18S-53]|uniref:DUF6636 domain-containing protein n=1 Tax=Humitalea sp. 24SJ18S-53 TaxID=3422307 RepID=UPI003D67930F
MKRLWAILVLLPVVASAQDTFQLPSGNIHCGWQGESLRCDILSYSFAPAPRPRGCDAEWGNSVEIGPRGPVKRLCHSDGVMNPGSAVLGYSTAWRMAGIECTAAPTGLRCVNADGRGFDMARTQLRLF